MWSSLLLAATICSVQGLFVNYNRIPTSADLFLQQVSPSPAFPGFPVRSQPRAILPAEPPARLPVAGFGNASFNTSDIITALGQFFGSTTTNAPIRSSTPANSVKSTSPRVKGIRSRNLTMGNETLGSQSKGPMLPVTMATTTTLRAVTTQPPKMITTRSQITTAPIADTSAPLSTNSNADHASRPSLAVNHVVKPSFSNPPPPYGSERDPGGNTCGIPPAFCARSRYRTIDGSCNNLQRPLWGVPQTPYGRLVPYNYADGVYALPVAKSGRPLPNPRAISLLLFPDRQLVDPVWNLNAQQWGQIVTHDMSLTAGVTQSHRHPITCCTADGQYAPDVNTNSQCAPIAIPSDDPVHSHEGRQCLNFVRTTTTRDRQCTAPNVPAEPLSTVTAYMDLSMVYGSSAGQAAPLRAGAGGRMLTEVRGGREWPPREPNITIVCESAQSFDEPCYLAGDIRVNQNPQLTLLQIMLLREHNRIADALAIINPHWDDETLFQEARRIAVAEIQHINYYEYLPIFLGVENMIKNKLIYPGASSYINDYDPSVDPTVLDEHATAAFRHFHTLIRGFLNLVNERRRATGAVRLSDWFNRPALLETGNSFDDLTRGLATQPQDFSDQFWDSEITQFLFKRNRTFGGDLRATDIQRGRDHALGSYVSQRRACGLPVPITFHQLRDFIPEENVQVLQSLYESVEDIELVVAGSLETNLPGALAGPTFLCILTEQFYRTRAGDRFFYENGLEADIAFTLPQLQEIRKSSIARIMCDNADQVRTMQPRAFQQINSENQLVPCEQLPALDLNLWRDVNVASYHVRK